MKISDILREDKTTISFEVFPPKTTANFESVKKAALGVAAPAIRRDIPIPSTKKRILKTSKRRWTQAVSS